MSTDYKKQLYFNECKNEIKQKCPAIIICKTGEDDRN